MGIRSLSLEAVRATARAEFFVLPVKKTIAEFVHERKPLPSLPFFHAPRGWTFKMPNERAAELKAA